MNELSENPQGCRKTSEWSGTNQCPVTPGGTGETPTPPSVLSSFTRYPTRAGDSSPALLSFMRRARPKQGVEGRFLVPPKTGPGGSSPVILNNTANLDAVLPVPFYPPTRCTPKFIVLSCKCGRRIVPSTCMSLDCSSCKDQVGKRRSWSVIKRILGPTLYQRRQYTGFNVIYTVFTIPPNAREGFFFNKSKWQKIRKKAWKILRDNFGAKFGVEVTHPAGDVNTATFHPHLNFIWIQRPGHRPFIDVNLLREKWNNALNLEKSDVHSQYTNKIARVVHWSKYVTRTFPGTHEWTGPMRWYGQYPKIPRPTECGCEECGQKFNVIGWIDARLVKKWEDTGMMMGLDPPWLNDANIVRLH